MTQVVTEIETNPKRPNSGAWHRYEAYYIGATQDDLVARGLTLRDIKWDLSQGHVKMGDGERVEPPPLAPVPQAPVQTRTTTRAVPEGSAGATVAQSPARQPSVSQSLPPVAASVAPGPVDKTAPYWSEPVRIDAQADRGGEDRVWRIDVTLPDGRRLWRRIPSDRLAAAIVQTASLHGVDADDWHTEG